MSIKHARFTLFVVVADDKYFFSWCIVSFTVKLGSFDWRNLYSDKISTEFDKIFDERSMSYCSI